LSPWILVRMLMRNQWQVFCMLVGHVASSEARDMRHPVWHSGKLARSLLLDAWYPHGNVRLHCEETGAW
jgi:hypothetical protein